jgi:nucleolar protein 9
VISPLTQSIDQTSGIVAESPVASTSAATLPLMSTILLSALSELLPFISTLIYDPFGSHAIRILLLVFSGQAPLSEGDKSRSAERSKKSQNWRGRQGAMKNFLGDDGKKDGHFSTEDDNKTTASEKRAKRKIPAEFTAALESMYIALNELDEGGPVGEGVRRAAMDDVAGPVMRILIELEAESKGGWKKGGWADRVLFGLVEEVANVESKTEARTESRAEYLTGLLRHPASSPTCETLLLLSSAPLFSALWADLFHTRLARLAGHTVGNFVVATALGRVNENEMKSAVKELFDIGRERRGEWIDNSRTGVMRSLLERAAVLKCCEKEVVEVRSNLNRSCQRLLIGSCIFSLR